MRNKPDFLMHFKPLHVVLMNKSGNVGKTTAANVICAPRLPNLHRIFYVEDMNTMPDMWPEPIGQTRLAQEFGDIEIVAMEAKARRESLVVDFGSSDFATTLELADQYSAFFNIVDVYVLPTLESAKEQADTIQTIDELILRGVQPDKIRILFNNVQLRDKTNIRRLFNPIFRHQAELEKSGETFVVDEELVMFKAEVFKRLATFTPPAKLLDWYDNDDDFISQLAETEDPEERFLLALSESTRGLVDNAVRMMNGLSVKLFEGI
jgi:hypothetical protein